MQKWCPEPFVPPAPAPARFETVSPAATAAVARGVAFRPETGFADKTALLHALSREERVQIVKLLEQDLRQQFEQRGDAERKAAAEAAAAQAATQAAARAAWQDALSAGLQAALRDAIADLARRTAEIAVLMAGKVVRREVAIDREVLVRCLETVLYKAEAGCSLSVTTHPEDAAWLAAATSLRERLRIRDLKEDRRVERGGCLVKIEETEWDATVSGQLAVLGEILDAALAVPSSPTGKDDHA